MSKLQKKYLLLGLLLIAVAALFPPTIRFYNARSHIHRAFLFLNDTVEAIYLGKLVTEWVLIATMTCFFMILDKGLFSWTYEARHRKENELSDDSAID